MEELNCDTAFTIPLFGGIKISESVAVTWIIMAVVVLLCVIFVRNLSVENPGKAQLLLESAIGKGVDFFEDVMGKENRRYIPYLITVLIYIGIANIIGLFGFKPPTKDLNVTIALAVMSMCLIEYSGILDQTPDWSQSVRQAASPPRNRLPQDACRARGPRRSKAER